MNDNEGENWQERQPTAAEDEKAIFHEMVGDGFKICR